MTYSFQPYDVLQVLRNGTWLDYSTLRTANEGAIAQKAVRHGVLDRETLEFRIVRNGLQSDGSYACGVVVCSR